MRLRPCKQRGRHCARAPYPNPEYNHKHDPCRWLMMWQLVRLTLTLPISATMTMTRAGGS